jgi:deazaflavin-dependent oxidoreductase (nitroreductase family)
VTDTAPPRLLTMLSRVPHRLLTLGVPMGPLVLLRTRGRRTGLTRAVPVALLRHDEQDWLVSPFGVTHWVRNLRADPLAQLGRGRRSRYVTLIEVVDERTISVLQHYRRRFGIVPFVRHAFDTTPAGGSGMLHDGVNRFPVFLVQPDVDHIRP